jgi:hypothetical protein
LARFCQAGEVLLHRFDGIIPFSVFSFAHQMVDILHLYGGDYILGCDHSVRLYFASFFAVVTSAVRRATQDSTAMVGIE